MLLVREGEVPLRLSRLTLLWGEEAALSERSSYRAEWAQTRQGDLLMSGSEKMLG